ncbi:MAG: UDP-N-acetylmuramate--L-alanine ligase [Patescibacteria group bacterium]
MNTLPATIYGGLKKRLRLFLHPYDQLFINPNTHFHFIGIGGIGMSAIAFLLKDRGYVVTGSDMKESDLTHKLQEAGIEVVVGHAEGNITQAIDVVVVSSAIPKANPEIVAAIKSGIPIVKRSFVLGKLMQSKKGIAVSGTHGKTTTTTMITLILQGGGLDPSALIGGEVKNIGGNFLSGKGDTVVVEACEYDRSFLDLYPYIAVITNIEADHLDYYRDIHEIKKAFEKFVKKIPKDGLLIIPSDDMNAVEVAKVATCKVVAFGFGGRSQMAKELFALYWEVEEVSQRKGVTTFSLSNGSKTHEFSLKIPGKHNVSDACAAIIASDFLGVSMDVAGEVLKGFEGTNRRFQIKGEKKDIVVVDDYAHHPTEIRATLEGAKKFYKGKKIIAIFEPHQYSRTHMLLSEFSHSFSNADLIIIPDIYPVRDTKEDMKKVSAQDLVTAINKNGVDALYIKDYDEIVAYLQKNIKEDSLIMTIGAGNVYKIGEMFLQSK